MAKKKYEKESLTLFALIMLCNVINYFFQIIVGRILNDVSDYGTMNALLSVLNIVSLPVAVIAMVVTKYIAEYNINDQKKAMKAFLYWITQKVFILVILVCLIGAFLSKYISGYIHVNSRLLIILIIFGAAISYLIQIAIGYFQGTKNFLHYGMYNLIAPAFKMLICVVVFLGGYKLLGLTISIVLSNCIAVLIGAIWLNYFFRNIKSENKTLSVKKIMNFSYSAVFMNVGITLLNNVDMVLIKHYFILESGYYSVASVLGKLVLYVSNTIVVILFPYTIEQNGRGKSTKGTLKKALLYGSSISIVASLGLIVFSEIIIKMMYGTSYLEATKYIIPIGVLVTALSVLTIIANYELALEKIKFVTVSMLVAVFLNGLAIVLYHENIMNVIWILATVAMLTAVVNLIRVLNARE